MSAEKGYLRETGNLVFHLSLLLLLVAVALGHLLGYKANVLLVEGEAFSNTVSAYDTVDRRVRSPTRTRWRRSRSSSTTSRCATRRAAQQRGAPRDFRAAVRYTASPRSAERSYDLRVNHPLKVDGVKVFLLGNGYAPVFTVRDRQRRGRVRRDRCRSCRGTATTPRPVW